jgi:hypothetical protein
LAYFLIGNESVPFFSDRNESSIGAVGGLISRSIFVGKSDINLSIPRGRLAAGVFEKPFYLVKGCLPNGGNRDSIRERYREKDRNNCQNNEQFHQCEGSASPFERIGEGFHLGSWFRIWNWCFV